MSDEEGKPAERERNEGVPVGQIHPLLPDADLLRFEEERVRVQKREKRDPATGLRVAIAGALCSLEACGLTGSGRGYVYAVGLRAIGIVKIGKCTDPMKRLVDIQHMNPTQLVLYGLSHFASLEDALHRRYASVRSHGEWFFLDRSPLPMSRAGCYGCDRRTRLGLDKVDSAIEDVLTRFNDDKCTRPPSARKAP